MEIQVNGILKPLAERTTLVELLAKLGFANKPVAVELNQSALTPAAIKDATLNDGDQLEIIVLAPGG